jgi:hypothetical protein
VLAAAGFAPAALASLPPGKRALVDLQRQSVGAIRVGDPLITRRRSSTAALPDG